MKDLTQLVRDKIAELGVTESAKLFGKSIGTISNWATGKTEPSIAAAQILLNELATNPAEAPETKPIDNDAVKLVSWEGKKVALLLPVYRTVNPDTHFTLFANYAKYGPERIGLYLKQRTVIHESRNELIHIAMMNKDIETFIMCDDDMVLPCGNDTIFNGNYRARVSKFSASLNAFSRLMSHGRDKEIVGALYYGRHEFGMPQCDWGFNVGANTRADEFRAERHHGLIKQNWVGTGLVKIERTAIEKYKKAIDEGKYPGLEPIAGRWYGYFTPLKAGVGEDVSFCHRMAKIGVQTYVDADLICLHADGGTFYGPKNTRNPGT